MKAVVTGGGGFLGSHVVKELLGRGYEVTTLSRAEYPSLPPSVHQVRCDLKDEAGLRSALRGAGAVFHTAARVGTWGPWREFYEANVVGTENVLAACRSNGVARFIYTSSPSVVFDGHDHRGVDESTPYPTQSLSPYSQSKRLAEELVLAANRDGLFTVSLRPHLVWGKGDRYLVPRVLEQARAGKLFRVGTGKNRVDIIHVTNAAKAHVDAALRLGPGSVVNGKAYFLSQGEPVVLWDFIDEVIRRAQLPRLKKRMSYKTAYRLGALLEWGHRLLAPTKEPRMTRFLAQTLACDHYYDIGAAKRELGYLPAISIEQGLDELFR